MSQIGWASLSLGKPILPVFPNLCLVRYKFLCYEWLNSKQIWDVHIHVRSSAVRSIPFLSSSLLVVCLFVWLIVWLFVCLFDWLFDCLIVWLFDDLFVCLFVWLFDCLIVWWFDLFVCLFDCLIVWLFDCLIVWLFDCLIVWLFDDLFVCLFDCLIVCLFVWLFDCLIVWLFVCLFVFVCWFVGLLVCWFAGVVVVVVLPLLPIRPIFAACLSSHIHGFSSSTWRPIFLTSKHLENTQQIRQGLNFQNHFFIKWWQWKLLYKWRFCWEYHRTKWWISSCCGWWHQRVPVAGAFESPFVGRGEEAAGSSSGWILPACCPTLVAPDGPVVWDAGASLVRLGGYFLLRLEIWWSIIESEDTCITVYTCIHIVLT